MKEAIKIEARREAYGISDIGYSLTVGELIDFLRRNYPEDMPIVISNDNGYTYGRITKGSFGMVEDDEEEYDEEWFFKILLINWKLLDII